MASESSTSGHTCLLIGSAGIGVIREDLQSRVVPKPKPSDTPKVGKALAEALNDIVSLTAFCKDREIEVAGTLYAQGVVKFTKQQTMDAIRSFFRQPNKKYFWLMYSGHGVKDTGDWSCYDGFISFREVMKEWKHSGTGMKKLFIFSDCCYSGAWKDILRDEMPAVDNVAIQASCLAHEVAYDGIFTKVFIKLQQEGSFGPCSCVQPGSEFCFLRNQCPGQHVAWRRAYRNDNDISETFGVELMTWGMWNDW